MWRSSLWVVALAIAFVNASVELELPAVQATGDHAATGSFFALEYDKIEGGTGSAEWSLEAEEVMVERAEDVRLFQALGNDHLVPKGSTGGWWRDASMLGQERGQDSYIGVYAYPGHDRPRFTLEGECLDAAPFEGDVVKPRRMSEAYTHYQAYNGHVFHVPIETGALVDAVCGDAFKLHVEGAFVATTWEYEATVEGLDDRGQQRRLDATSGYFEAVSVEDPRNGDPVQQTGIHRQVWIYTENATLTIDVRGHHVATLITATADVAGPIHLSPELADEAGSTVVEALELRYGDPDALRVTIPGGENAKPAGPVVLPDAPALWPILLVLAVLVAATRPWRGHQAWLRTGFVHEGRGRRLLARHAAWQSLLRKRSLDGYFLTSRTSKPRSAWKAMLRAADLAGDCKEGAEAAYQAALHAARAGLRTAARHALERAARWDVSYWARAEADPLLRGLATQSN